MRLELNNLTQILENEINSYFLPSSPKNLYEPLSYFLDLGGKRIRPILTVLSADLFGVEFEDVKHAALAIEFFHNFSLIHDDIMDEAPLRRAKETIHTKWNSNIAILSGDVLLIKAYQEIAKQKKEHIPELLDLFNKTAVEVCEGQQMDMDFEKEKTISIAQYIEMIRLKTSVLLACALDFGAIIANESKENRKLIYEFGENIGIAFQIQDDLLDLYADAAVFGKQIGGDIISNKKTILQLKAIELANPFQKEFLQNISQITDSEEKIQQTLQVFKELNVKNEVKKVRDSYFEKSLTALEKINVTEEKKLKLKELASILKNREV